jgi:hypothetical protein
MGKRKMKGWIYVKRDREGDGKRESANVLDIGK